VCSPQDPARRRPAGSQHTKRPRSTELLRLVVCHIEENAAKATISGIARELGFSRRWVLEEVKRQTGGSFRKLRNKILLRTAARLLRCPDLDLRATSAAMGFAHYGSFARWFLRHQDVSAGNKNLW